MPSFSSSSIVRTADTSLLLDITHVLVQNSPSDIVHTVRGNFPEDVDVLLTSDLVITLLGTLDRVKISSTDIEKSAVALHFKRYLQANAGLLGLSTVSDVYIDESDGLPKLTVTSTRPLNHAIPFSHATLVSIRVHYKWRSKKNAVVEGDINSLGNFDHNNPFSSTLFLPFQTLLNTIIEKFVSVHLVKRYPLIFGLWCKKLDIEIPFFIPIGRSIFNILERSPNGSFVKQCRRLMTNLRKQNRRALHTSLISLSTYLHTSNWIQEVPSDDNKAEEPTYVLVTDETTLFMAMERLFKHVVPRSRFKGSASTRLMATDTEHADEFDFGQCPTTHIDSPQAQDMSSFWDDLSMSPKVESSPFMSASHGRDCMLLKDYNTDEYFLDDEGEWMQDGVRGWVWRASERLVHFDSDIDEDYRLSTGTDLEETLTDSSQDLFLTPCSQTLLPNLLDTDSRQISAETDNSEIKSQDCGAAPCVPNTTHLDTSPSNPTSNQEQPSNLIARHQHPLSKPAYLDQSVKYDMDTHSDASSVSDILHDFEYDVPGILSGSFTPAASDIDSRDSESVNGTAGTVTRPQSVEAPPGGGDWEESSLLDFDM